MEELANRVLDREPEAIAEAQKIRVAKAESPEAAQKWEELWSAMAKAEWTMRTFLAERGIKGELSRAIGDHIDEHYAPRVCIDGVCVMMRDLGNQVYNLGCSIEKEFGTGCAVKQ